jgi:hypothetical protein
MFETPTNYFFARVKNDLMCVCRSPLPLNPDAIEAFYLSAATVTPGVELTRTAALPTRNAAQCSVLINSALTAKNR